MRFLDVTSSSLPFAALAVVLLGLPACPKTVNVEGICKSDEDCGDFNRCDASGVCLCKSDDACDAAEFCNLAGSCQQKLQCFSDDDCATADNPASICDTRLPIEADDFITVEDNIQSRTSGSCVTLNSSNVQCLMDSHCPFGFFCQSVTGGGVCQPGCRDNGDCTLGDPCINGQCDSTPGACNEAIYCDFGQVCGGNNACQDHPEASTLCGRCDPQDLFNNPCPISEGLGGPTCLIDQTVVPTACTSDAQCGADLCVRPQCLEDADCSGGATCEGGGIFTPGNCSTGQCGNFFCGTSFCNEENPCPRGYACNVLITVSGGGCTPGSGTAECPGNGSTCLGGGETEEQGFCSCTSDADCPVGGEGCLDPGPTGICIAGSTCGPADGLTCADVQ